MTTEYGKRLRAARVYAKLTQQGLAAKTGISQSTISTAERENQGSSDTSVFAKACRVDAHWLATGEGSMSLSKVLVNAEHTVGPTADIDSMLLTLSSFLDQVPHDDRQTLESLLASLVRKPGDPRITGAIKLMLDSQAFVPAEKIKA